jgi:hypothetical protein
MLSARIFLKDTLFGLGAKGLVCGPEGAWLSDNRVLTKLRKCHLFLQVPYVHVHVMAPGQRL